MLLYYRAESDLSSREAADSLAANVSQWRWFSFPKTLFVGKVSDTGFRIARVVRGRDSFNPMLYGRFSRSHTGTRVKVFITLHPAVLMLMVAWSAFLGHTIFLRGNSELVGWAFVLAPWILAIPSFFYGAGRSKALLQKCLRLHDQHCG